MFKGQIKEFQKRLQKAKEKAELNEKRFKGSLLEHKSAEKIEGSRPRNHIRKPSVTMPRPDGSNTVSLSGKPIPKIGDGSAETLSLSNLKQQPPKGNAGAKTQKNTGMHRLRSSLFGGKPRA